MIPALSPAAPSHAALSAAAFIRANTAIADAPLVPEIRLHLATEITPIWQATEALLDTQGLGPPFWAFAWPGSQALARHVLDNPRLVQGRRILDFASGGGLAAIACSIAGAASVEAADIDPLAAEATRINAALNAVPAITTTARDVVGEPCRWDLILCGDVCYEAPMTAHIMPWLIRLAAGAATCARPGAEVWIADPGRNYLPAGLEVLAEYTVPTSLELEDKPSRHTRLLRLPTVR